MSRRHIESQLIEVRADQQAADARLLVAIGQEHKAHDKYLEASTGEGEELVASLWLMRRDRWRTAQEDARKERDDDQREIDRLLDLLPAPRTPE